MTGEGPTIAALLTPLAPGAIAVVALAGPQTRNILGTILRRPRSDEPLSLAPACPALCRIVDGDAFLDDAVAVLLEGSAGSRAELCTHGGVRIAQRLLQLLERLGAKVVPAQEFCNLVAPVHSVERDVDRALLGAPARRLTQWLLAQRGILPDYLDRIQSLSIAERDAFGARSRVAIRLLQGLSIALIGPPNAGKSTLANRLIGRDRVITSDVPGTTRDWVSETALIEGWPVTLTDTAGIRETECAIETEAIHRGREEASRADLVLVVLDAATSVAEQSASLDRMTNMLPAEASRIVVLNKCDLAGSVNGVSASDSRVSPHRVSAVTGFGIATMETQIARQFGLDVLANEMATGFLPSHLQ